MRDSSSGDRDTAAHTAQDIYCLALYRKKFADSLPFNNDIIQLNKDNESSYFLLPWFSVFYVYLLLFMYIFFILAMYIKLGVSGINMGISLQKLNFQLLFLLFLLLYHNWP